MVTRRDYTAEGVEAAHSVLIELVHLLGEYKDDIVLIGGWVPEVLLPHQSSGHVGSMDVDLALNHQKIQDAGYKMIQELLTSRGYEQGPQPFIFFRSVNIRGTTVKVQVDLLAGEYEDLSKGIAIRKCKAYRREKQGGVTWSLRCQKRLG